eukprot:201954-Chlamydomonas_euryale.AAC.1
MGYSKAMPQGMTGHCPDPPRSLTPPTLHRPCGMTDDAVFKSAKGARSPVRRHVSPGGHEVHATHGQANNLVPRPLCSRRCA